MTESLRDSSLPGGATAGAGLLVAPALLASGFGCGFSLDLDLLRSPIPLLSEILGRRLPLYPGSSRPAVGFVKLGRKVLKHVHGCGPAVSTG